MAQGGDFTRGNVGGPEDSTTDLYSKVITMLIEFLGNRR